MQTRMVHPVSTRIIYNLLSDGGAGTSETDHISQIQQHTPLSGGARTTSKGETKLKVMYNEQE